ncbi:hypothetical protein KQY30_20125 [Streptomyces sp. GMY02]|nr:hypothetical protein KQY30_20125 [Streptomyces sp. GMY02]
MDETVLTLGRAAAERRMHDQVTIAWPGEDGFDWETGTDTRAPGTVLYEGRARIKSVARTGEEVEAGEQNVTLREFVVSVPWATPPPTQRIAPGAVVTVTVSRDARFVGLTLWVTGVEYGDAATAWRISAEDRS